MWRRLGNDILFCEKAVIDMPYFINGSKSNRGSNKNYGYGPTMYEESLVRAYLNGKKYLKEYSTTGNLYGEEFSDKGFINTAFTKSMLSGWKTPETALKNTKDACLGTAEVNTSLPEDHNGYMYPRLGDELKYDDENDKVFLMSLSQITDRKYNFDKEESRKVISLGKTKMWLRAPYSPYHLYTLEEDGKISIYEDENNDSDWYANSFNAVVPALYIDGSLLNAVTE